MGISKGGFQMIRKWTIWMWRWGKRFTSLALAAVLVLTGAGQAQAETRTKIEEVNLYIDSAIESGVSGGNVCVSTSDSEYRVGDVEILNEDDDWIGGMRPKITVDLYANSGYYFAGKSKSMFHLSGDEASYSTARLEDSKSTLVLTLKLDKLENGDLTVTGAVWDESDGTAVWDDNPNAKYYQVKLYRDDSSVTGTRTVDEHYYEFADDITRRGDYYFEVRAVGSDSEKGDWESSDCWYVSSSEAEDISGYDGPGSWSSWGSSWGPGVVGDGYYNGYYGYGAYAGPGGAVYGVNGGPGVSADSGYSNGYNNGYNNGCNNGPGVTTGIGGHWCLDQYGWWYQYSNNTYPRNCWQCIDGLYYCFNDSGYLRYGWIYWDNKWYYCGEDGALLANTQTPDGYYVGGDGVWIP